MLWSSGVILEEIKQGNKKYEEKRAAKLRDEVSKLKAPCNEWDNMKMVFSFLTVFSYKRMLIYLKENIYVNSIVSLWMNIIKFSY